MRFYSIVLWVVFLGLCGYLGYLYYTRPIPCVTPIYYALESYDARYPVSRPQLVRDIDAAAGVWNDAIGKPVLVPAQDTVDLPIYLIYDNRQATDNKEVSLDAAVSAKEMQLNDLANAYARTKDPRIAAQYEALRQSINADISAYNRTIPQDEYNEARYASNARGARIDIYSFKSEPALRRILEHELGHALGLEHVQGESSIMYPVNKGEVLELSTQDKAELERACSTPRPFLHR